MSSKKMYYTSIVLFVLIALVCIFTIPYLFPSNQISISASYDYGFNNFIGILILGFFSLLILIFSFFKNRTYNKKIDVFIDEPKKKIVNKVFLIVAGITLVGCCLLWFVLGRDSYGLMESGYFIPHIYDLEFGKKAYLDFEFIYGPVLLYVPYFIYKLFSFISLSISDGYIITLMINQLLGLYFLYYILSFLDISEKRKNGAFITIAIFSFPISVGLNYTLFRFVFPYFCFVFLWRIERKAIASLIFSAILPILVILTSPELGLALYFSCFIYTVIKFILSRSKIYLFHICILISSFFLVLLLLPDMFKSTSGFISGGMNWPFIPSITLIIFFIAVFLLSRGIGIQLCNLNKYLFTLSFILMAFVAIAGALGRCDPGHVFFYGLFIFILAYAQIGIYSKRLCFISGIVFGAVFLFSLYPYAIKMYIPAYGYSVMKNLGKLDDLPSVVISMGNIWGIDIDEKIKTRQTRGVLNYEESFADVNDVTMPFADNEIYIYLNKTKKYNDLYYRNPKSINTDYANKRNLMELQEKNIEYLLLPQEWKELTALSDYSGINLLFITYYPAVQKRNGNIIYNQLLEYVANNYEYVKNIGSYFLYRKIDKQSF
jgi:hypothetical protein